MATLNLIVSDPPAQAERGLPSGGEAFHAGDERQHEAPRLQQPEIDHPAPKTALNFLAESKTTAIEHVGEAIQYRTLDRNLWA